METTIKQRLRYFLRVSNITHEEFGKNIGVSTAYVSSMRKGIQPDKLARIQQAYPDLNIEWLVTGRGNMLNTPQHMSVINNGTNSGTMGNNVSITNNSQDAEYHETEEIPIVPRRLYNEPNLDVLDYVNHNNVQTSPVVKQFPTAQLWWPVYTDKMLPDYRPGDKLALLSYPQGEECILNGDCYVVDTKQNGMILCRLEYRNNSYIATYTNSLMIDTLAPEQIIRIYKIMGQLRIKG